MKSRATQPDLTKPPAGLNCRFGWPPALPLWLALIGLALVVVGWALGTWAMVANRFFSAVVRTPSARPTAAHGGGRRPLPLGAPSRVCRRHDRQSGRAAQAPDRPGR